MRVAVTGTPGTGKTSVTDHLASEGDYEVVHLNDVVRTEGFHDGEDAARGSLYADLESLGAWIDEYHDSSRREHDQGGARERAANGERGAAPRPLLVESHLAHHLPADRVVVLRCHPAELERRLGDRGEPTAKVRENAEAEALDVVLSEAVAEHGTDVVYEVDTTDQSVATVAAAVEAVVTGEREPSAGTVSFTDWL